MCANTNGMMDKHRRCRRGPLTFAKIYCKKDQDTLIEQSATLIKQSTTIFVKPVGSNVVKCLNIHSQSF